MLEIRVPLCAMPCFPLKLTAASRRNWQEFQCQEPAKMLTARFGNKRAVPCSHWELFLPFFATTVLETEMQN